MRILLLALCLHMTFALTGQGTTTSDMQGRVTGPDGETLIGANVMATHLPSGTTFGTVTDLEGQYQIPGMKVGGPYRVTASYTGYTESTIENVQLRLGETYRHNFQLSEANVELNSVTVLAAAGVTGQTAGTSTQITAEQIETVPSLNRDIDDYLRLTPQANKYSDGISIAGVNNRYNAIYIDGAVNNDVYGLASSGTNGGQTNISPFSIDIIDQFQVVISPYDVSLGGFAGGGINAVTKSGTNTLSGTAYYFLQNEGLAGKTNGIQSSRLATALNSNDPDTFRTKLADFTKSIYGASLGGAIKKDKIFFFANVELQDDETPLPFDLAEYTTKQAGRIQQAQLDQLKQVLINQYGYDPGNYGTTEDQLEGLKLFGKLDFNLNNNNRLTLRHQYTKAENIDRLINTLDVIYFDNAGQFFPSTTNSSALEWNSRLGQRASNNLILGFTKVHDDRDPLGDPFPYVQINDVSGGSVQFGSEEFSTANLLDQTTFTLTDNLKLYRGNHTFTLGTHNEFYSFNNIFVGQNFGRYTFDSFEDFVNDSTAILYTRTYSLIDSLSGDETTAAADFNAMQFGFYVQDEWAINSKFTLTGGIRLDIPVITTDPVEDTLFNNQVLPLIQEDYPELTDGLRAGKAPDGQIMISPRVGFEYDLNGNRKTIIRGGAGIFTSRVPFVWPGAMFTNNGLTIGSVAQGNLGGRVDFIPDVKEQYVHPNFNIPSGQVDLFVNDFKYPQVFRTNLAWDQKFGAGWEFSLEGLFTKTLNNINYTNVNSRPDTAFTWTGSGDHRDVFVNQSIASRYNAVYLASNTSEGYTYNFTASLAKSFASGFNAYVAYNYGDGKAVSEGTSSQNSSQWRGQVHINGRNNPVLGRTDFAIGHRVLANLTYRKKWSEGIATSVSLFYNGESGEAYSYTIGGNNSNNLNRETGSTGRRRTLVYVPMDENDINLVPYVSGTDTISVAEQWANLNAFIESDKHLSERRGQYAEKNGSFAPFTSQFDLVLRQDFGTNLGGDLHRIQVSFDIFNVANLLNNEWGVVYTVPGTENVDFNNFQLYQFERYDPVDTHKPLFTYRGTKTGKDAFNIDNVNSRWRMRLGVRYIFN